MTTRMTQQELESYLWGAAIILRGLVDAGDYKQFIFPLVFFKRLSDVWDEDYNTSFDESKCDVEYATATANDRFVIPEGAHWKDVRSAAKDVGKKLQNALRAIEAANPGRLDGIFGDAAWTNKERLPDVTLKNLLEHFSGQVMSIANVPEDELGNGYEFLIKKFADDSGHTAQEFYTNRTVVHLMVQILEPKSGESIYDPTCGTGGMLISALAEVKRRGGEHRTLKLFGQERNHMTASIARMNLVLHGVEDSEIARGDTLSAPAFYEGDTLKTFDVVLANPPYSIKQWNREAWATDPWGRNRFGAPPQNSADLAFVQHIIASMSPTTGRSVTLLPHGFLARESERAVRGELIRADVIDAVIGLGRRLFFNSGMESCLLICRSRRDPQRRGRILFIDAAPLVAKEGANNKLLPEHQTAIADAYRKFSAVPGLAAVATIDEVRLAGETLSINQYVSRASSLKRTETDTIESAWEKIESSGDAVWQQVDEVVEMLESTLQDGAIDD